MSILLMSKPKSNIIQDSEIITLLGDNPRNAIAQILDKYGDALYGSVLRITQSKEVAEDIMQVASVKIWKNASSYDPAKGRLFTWLLNVCRNAALDKVRTAKYKRTQTSESIDSTVYDNVSHSEEMEIEDVGLRRTLNLLEPKYREVIDLLYLQGYTQREATEELGIPLGTVKSRVKVGIRELRILLKDHVTLWVMLFFNY
jgi:RNA polymerase sigma-70 factor (ECF subfamily)